MEIAKVMPLFKTGDRHHFTNYRPVSLLPQFSKILEKLFTDRLPVSRLCFSMNLSSQYGFRRDRSTSHNTLFNKVERCGIRGGWIELAEKLFKKQAVVLCK